VTINTSLIFLDIDGVLITGSSGNMVTSHGVMSYMEPSCLKSLSKILRCQAKPKIVISSSWRISMSNTELAFADNNASDIWGFVIGNTGSYLTTRSDEIRKYLDNNDYLDYVIIDDHDMTTSFGPRMFVTEFNIGLTNKIADDIIEYFGG
jgi:hypothetical protein